MKTSKDFPEVLINWDLFVLRHQNQKNVAVHLISFLMFWLCPLFAVAINPWFFLGFFLSGLVGTAGHYFFIDGTVDAKEATSSIQVVAFSSKMAFLFVTGKYGQEIQYVTQKWEKYKKGEIKSIADEEMFSKLGTSV
jgi:hypothetical protein